MSEVQTVSIQVKYTTDETNLAYTNNTQYSTRFILKSKKERVCHETWRLQDDLKVLFNLWKKLRVFSQLLFQKLSSRSRHKIILVLAFPKCGLPFLCCQYYQVILEFRSQILIYFKKLFQRSKNTLNESSSYCQVSWDTSKIMKEMRSKMELD